MPADPNWLYSAIAQSSAAIVAIIGGFIMSTLLVLSSDRQSLLARLYEREEEIKAFRSQRKRALQNYEERRVAFQLSDDLDDIVKLDPLPDAESAQQQLDAQDLDREEFARQWDALVRSIQRERMLLEADIEQHGVGGEGFDAWAKEHNIDLIDRDEQLAERLYHQIVSRRRKQHRDAIGYFAMPITAMLPSAIISPEANRLKWDRRDRELEGYEEVAEDMERRTALAEAECQVLRERLRNFRYPAHLAAGLWVLASFAISGILLPFLLMPQEPREFTGWHKAWALGGFGLGASMVAGYMGFLLRELRSPKDPRQD